MSMVRSTGLFSILILTHFELLSFCFRLLGVWRRPRWRRGQALRVAYGQP